MTAKLCEAKSVINSTMELNPANGEVENSTFVLFGIP